MTETAAPHIEFPCADYPIKVVGDFSAHFRGFVEGVMSKYDPAFDLTKVRIRLSRNGRFLAVNVMVTATSVEQLGDIFAELKSNAAVRLVL